MILDRRDVELLRLTGKYRWLPFGCFDAFGLAGLNEASELLSKAGLITVSRNRQYFRLSSYGYELLEAQGYLFEPGSKRAFSGSTALRRRLEVAGIMLTCLRAGIDNHQDDVFSLSKQPVFLPAFELRDGTNLMSNANCAGFGHWGNKAYMLQYVSKENAGMVDGNELYRFRNLQSTFDQSLNIDYAMIFAGSSYREVYRQLKNIEPSERHGKRGFHDFWHIYQKADLPVHLLSCDETGAMQLHVMMEPDYNAKIARAALGDKWTPVDPEIPEADGCVNGNPLVIAADMDVRRVEYVCKAARMQGRAEVVVAALINQIGGLLGEILPNDGSVDVYEINEEALEAAFGKRFSLHTISRSPEAGRKGGVVYV